MSTLEQTIIHKREALGYFWRALATAAAAQLFLAVVSAHRDLVLVLNTAVCAAFLARFSIGNYHYALSVFSITASWINGEHPERRLRARFAWDSVLFAIHLAALLWMASEAHDAHLFRLAVLALLLSDLLYLAFDRYAAPEWFLLLRGARASRAAGNEVSFTCDWPRHYTPRTWIKINLACAVLVVLLELAARQYPLSDRSATISLAAICAVNSILDIVLTKLEVSL